jgi:hypothetical protein
MLQKEEHAWSWFCLNWKGTPVEIVDWSIHAEGKSRV